MLFQNLRLGSWTRRLRRRKRILVFRKAVNISEQIKDSQKICICMPPDHKYFYEARDFLKNISTKKMSISIVLIRGQEALSEHKGPILNYPPPLKKAFPIPEAQVPGLPKSFDIAIDLSPEPTPLTAYITGTRAKKLSIGMQSPKLDAFYTVVIQSKGEYRDSLKSMFSFLQEEGIE